MTTVETLEAAVSQLPPRDLAEFRRWFAEFDAAAWDKQIETDAASGKLDALAAEAVAEYDAGQARELWGISPRAVSGSASTPCRPKSSGLPNAITRC